MRIFVILLFFSLFSFKSFSEPLTIYYINNPYYSKPNKVLGIFEYSPSGKDVNLLESYLSIDDNYTDYNYVKVDDVPTLLKRVSESPNSMGIGGISVLPDRLDSIEYGVSYETDSGIGAVYYKPSFVESGLITTEVINAIKRLLLTFIIVITIFAHLIWLVERNNNDNNNFHKLYSKGIGHSYWWSIVTSTTVGYGDMVPKKPLGRFVATFVMIFGIMWYGSISASISTIITLATREKNVSIDMHQLSINRVGTVKESSSLEFCINNNVKIDNFYDDSEQLVDAVDRGEIDVGIYDKNSLVHESKDKKYARVSNSVLKNEQYAFVFNKENYELRKNMNKFLLTLINNGNIDSFSDSAPINVVVKGSE